MAEQLAKWVVTNATVLRHRHYGLRVQVPYGEIGVVDRTDIADGPVDPADWPSIGSLITVVSGAMQVANFG